MHHTFQQGRRVCHQTCSVSSTPSRHWTRKLQVWVGIRHPQAACCACIHPHKSMYDCITSIRTTCTELQHTIQQLAEQCIARHPQYLPSSRSSPGSAAGGDQEDVCGWALCVVFVEHIPGCILVNDPYTCACIHT